MKTRGGRHDLRPVLVAVLLASGTARAQPLEAFLEAARTRNLDYLEAVSVHEQAGQEASLAWSRLAPRVVSRGSYTRNQYSAVFDVALAPGQPVQSLVITPFDQFDAKIELQVPLVDAAQWTRIGASQLQERAAERSMEASYLDVSRAVIDAYYQLAAARAIAGAARRAVQAAEELVGFTGARQGAGAASELDGARADTELARRRQALAEAERSANVGARTLESLTSLLPGPDVGIPDDALKAEEPLARWVAHAVSVHPAVLAARERAQAAKQEVTASWLGYAPAVGGNFAENLTNATAFLEQRRFYAASVVLSWPLDLSTARAAKLAEERARQAELQVEQAERHVTDDTYERWYEVSSLLEKVRASRDQARATRRVSDLVNVRFRAGAASSFEVVEALRDAFLAEADARLQEAKLAAARAGLRVSAGLGPRDELPGGAAP